MSYQIALPAGLEFIETWEIPYLLTQAKYPDIPRAGVSAAEILGKSETGDDATVEFSDADLALLERIWRGRANWRAGVPLHVFADYLAAFNDSPERPVWNLRWIASGGRHLSERVEFDAAVLRDIENGTLPVRRKSTLEVIQLKERMQDTHRNSVVSVEDFMLYAKGFLVDVLRGDPAISTPSKKGPGRPKSEAQLLLDKIIDALEEFAASNKEPFDRRAMPGPLGKDWHEEGSFHWLCAEIHSSFRRAKTTFEKHRAGICAISGYAKPTDFYSRALPVIAPKLRGGSNVHSVPKKTKKIH